MKKLLSFIAPLAVIFAISSCSGPVGPQGPQGAQGIPGLDGGIELAQAFEIVTDFAPSNEYSLLEPYGFEVFPSDVTLVYVLWDADADGNEIWRMLPQTAYLDNGLLTYNFDFTSLDVNIFLDGTVANFATVPDAYLLDQVFRVVVIPAEFVGGGRQDFTYENITEKFNLTDESFTRRVLN